MAKSFISTLRQVKVFGTILATSTTARSTRSTRRKKKQIEQQVMTTQRGGQCGHVLRRFELFRRIYLPD
ncbi:unnamed protein product [Symbiodinium pilosum]|uniref:Uncharacterized protein n=1 Tax=Symbiodinium pilosum TaxID=2952 RepID=A0A812LB00_SYMPI|nr:unnamed protein product [Symbiodinium pilosum]